MRILLLTHYYAPEVGPPQLRWSALVRELRARGHEVHVMAPPPHYPLGQLLPNQSQDQVGTVQAGCHGETVHRVRWRPTSASPLSTLLDQALAAGDTVITGWRRRDVISPDVVIATAPAMPTLAAGWVLARLLDRPLVLEMRDAWPDLGADAVTDSGSLSLRRRGTRYAVAAATAGVTAVQRRADLLVTTTDSFTDLLRRRGMPRVVTVRNAHHPVPGMATSAVDPRHDGLRVVYVGTVGRAQDLESAVLAVAEARTGGVDVRLRVVGTGARLESLRALVDRLDVPVEILGPVPREQIAEHYRWADTLLVSLRDWPGLSRAVPSKLYEALAMGVHVSGMAAGESREIIESTGAGFAVPPGDHRALAENWIRLSSERPRADESAMRAWVEEHATEAGTASAYEDALGWVLGESSGGAPGGLRLLLQRARHLAAAAGTVASMAREDPTWLTVQAGRRLPSRLRSTIGGWSTRRTVGLLGVWGELLVDRPDRARDRLARIEARGNLAGTLAVHAGAQPAPQTPAAHRARWAWLVGDLSTARSLVETGDIPTRLRDKIGGDLEALSSGPRPLPTARRTWSPGPEQRVLHVLTNSLPWTRSGYTMRTHSILTAQRDAGTAVAAMTRPAYPVSIGRVLTAGVDVVDGIAYHRCVPSRLPLGEAQRVDVWAEHLVRLAERHRATHLHSTTHYPNALAAQAAARALDLPWVHEVRGQLERTWASARRRHGDADPYGTERFALWRAREAELAAAADHVITLSAVMKADLAARGVDTARITVVPNGIDAALLDRDIDPAQARRRLGLPPGGLWVGAVSSVVHYEGFDTLVEAVALARSRGLDVRAAVVGDGVAWPGLREKVRTLGLAEHVLLPGRLARQESLRWLDALDVVVLPREDHEVTRLVPPLKVAEAMGAGRAVIASNLPALAEIVAHDETGLLVPPGDVAQLACAIAELDDPVRRALVGARAREQATGLTWQALCKAYRDAYRRSV